MIHERFIEELKNNINKRMDEAINPNFKRGLRWARTEIDRLYRLKYKGIKIQKTK